MAKRQDPPEGTKAGWDMDPHKEDQLHDDSPEHHERRARLSASAKGWQVAEGVPVRSSERQGSHGAPRSQAHAQGRPVWSDFRPHPLHACPPPQRPGISHPQWRQVLRHDSGAAPSATPRLRASASQITCEVRGKRKSSRSSWRATRCATNLGEVNRLLNAQHASSVACATRRVVQLFARQGERCAQRVVLEHEAVGVVNDAAEDGVGEATLADDAVPMIAGISLTMRFISLRCSSSHESPTRVGCRHRLDSSAREERARLASRTANVRPACCCPC